MALRHPVSKPGMKSEPSCESDDELSIDIAATAFWRVGQAIGAGQGDRLVPMRRQAAGSRVLQRCEAPIVVVGHLSARTRSDNDATMPAWLPAARLLSRREGNSDDGGGNHDEDENVDTHHAESFLLGDGLVGIFAEASLNSSVDGGLPAASSSVPKGAAAGSGQSCRPSFLD